MENVRVKNGYTELPGNPEKLNQSGSNGYQKKNEITLQLVVQNGPGAGLVFDLLVKPTLIIGQWAGCDILLKDERISGQHLQIETRNGILLVTDLGSVHGSYLNGLRLYPFMPMPLKERDYLLVGATVLLFKIVCDYPGHNMPGDYPVVPPGEFLTSQRNFNRPPSYPDSSRERSRSHPVSSPPNNLNNYLSQELPASRAPQPIHYSAQGRPDQLVPGTPLRSENFLPPGSGQVSFHPPVATDPRISGESLPPGSPASQAGGEYRGKEELEFPVVKRNTGAVSRSEGPLPPVERLNTAFTPESDRSPVGGIPLQPARPLFEPARSFEMPGVQVQSSPDLPVNERATGMPPLYPVRNGFPRPHLNAEVPFSDRPTLQYRQPKAADRIPPTPPFSQIVAPPLSQPPFRPEIPQNLAGSSPLLTLPGSRIFLNPWLAMLALMFGFFMALLDSTVVNIALTDIQKNLNTDLTTVSWVLNGYNLIFAVLLVTMGRFADLFGRKRLYMLGMILFSLGSLLCAVSPTIELLIGSRGIQALGAAALNPISLAIITVIFPPKKRIAAISIWGALAGLAAAIGPVLGGVLVQNFEWRSIFLVNLPFCIVGLFLVYRFVPETKDPLATRKLDLPGLTTLTTGMFCLMLAIIQGNDWGWNSVSILVLFAAGAVSLLVFFVIETRVLHPILDLSLFRYRSFTMVNITAFMFSIALIGAFLMLVLYYINLRGYDILHAGYALIPLPLASFLISAITGSLSQKLNPRYQGVAGMALITIGFFSLTTLNIDSTYLDTAWRSSLIGIGMGLCFTSFPAMVLADIPKSKVGVGSGAYNTSRQIGFALGVAILVSVFTGQLKDNLAVARTNAVQIVQKDANLPLEIRSTIVNALQSAGKGGNESDRQFDLTSLAEKLPDGQTLKPELTNLNEQITAEFNKGTLNAFIFTWLISALTGLLGLIPAFFTRAPAKAHQGNGTLGTIKGL